MKKQIQACNLFSTPDDIEALNEYVDRFTGNEKQIANIIMMMTWNLCAKITNEEEEEK